MILPTRILLEVPKHPLFTFSVAPYATRKIPTSPEFTIIPTDLYLVYHLIAEGLGLIVVSNKAYATPELAVLDSSTFIKSVLASIPVPP